MKNNNKIVAALLMLALLTTGIFTGCSSDEDPDENIVRFENIQITGGEEVPSNASTATGLFNGTFDKTTKILTYTLTFTGLTPTNMHFHKGAIGVSGPVAIGISSSPYTSPINSATPALTAEQEADLLNGLWYVNIHSAAFPPGEIRGQVD